MKKILILAAAILIVISGATAQKGKTRQRNSSKNSPVIEGRHKIRQSDYETFDKFTQFSSKDLSRYYCQFDYSRIPVLTKRTTPEWGDMQPVMNYLEKVSRATMTVCAIYAVNPDIDDAERHKELAAAAQKEALDALNEFDAWKARREWRNKVQYKVAEVDYRYFKGNDYYNQKTDDEVIRVGLLLYFGSKKKNIIDPDTTSRTFQDIKFFPNDATIQPSWNTLLDEVAQYLKDNERKGVLISGYTDNRGTEAYIKGLSRQRATEVRKALQMRGIAAERIETEAKGDADPIGDNSTYEGRVQNNRVSIKVQ